MGVFKKEAITSLPYEGCVWLMVLIYTAKADSYTGTESKADFQSFETVEAATCAWESQRGSVENQNLAQKLIAEIEKKRQVVEYNLKCSVCEKNVSGPSQGAQCMKMTSENGKSK